jgi:hypothetical protein
VPSLRRSHRSGRSYGRESIVIWIVLVVAAVVVLDVIWARARLRLRSRHPAPTAAHQLVGIGSSG